MKWICGKNLSKGMVMVQNDVVNRIYIHVFWIYYWYSAAGLCCVYGLWSHYLADISFNVFFSIISQFNFSEFAYHQMSQNQLKTKLSCENYNNNTEISST